MTTTCRMGGREAALTPGGPVAPTPASATTAAPAAQSPAYLRITQAPFAAAGKYVKTPTLAGCPHRLSWLWQPVQKFVVVVATSTEVCGDCGNHYRCPLQAGLMAAARTPVAMARATTSAATASTASGDAVTVPVARQKS